MQCCRVPGSAGGDRLRPGGAQGARLRRRRRRDPARSPRRRVFHRTGGHPRHPGLEEPGAQSHGSGPAGRQSLVAPGQRYSGRRLDADRPARSAHHPAKRVPAVAGSGGHRPRGPQREVAVVGAVKIPGRYEIKSPTTVLELLAQAQGLTEFASRDRIVVLRQNGGTTTRILSTIGKRRGIGERQLLRPSGDITWCHKRLS